MANDDGGPLDDGLARFSQAVRDAAVDQFFEWVAKTHQHGYEIVKENPEYDSHDDSPYGRQPEYINCLDLDEVKKAYRDAR